jgi:hypothetical protein
MTSLRRAADEVSALVPAARALQALASANSAAGSPIPAACRRHASAVSPVIVSLSRRRARIIHAAE